MNQTIGNAAVAPHRAGEVNSETIHRSPTGDAAAELFELPGIQVRKRSWVMMNQLVGDEAVGRLRHVDQKIGEFEDYVRGRVLEPMREFAADFAQLGCGRTAGET